MVAQLEHLAFVGMPSLTTVTPDETPVPFHSPACAACLV
jgi:hypothetical protein